MGKAAVRIVCVILLLATVAVRFDADRARQVMMTEFDASLAVAEILHDNGLQTQENPVKAPLLLSPIVYFQRPECDRASLVFPFFINAEMEPLLARVTSPDFKRHFYFLDGDWQEQHRVSMFFIWLKYAALDLIGSSPYVPMKRAIVLADPPNCNATAVIDWRPLWTKNRKRGPVDVHNITASKAAPG